MIIKHKFQIMEFTILAQRYPDADTLVPSARWSEAAIAVLRNKQMRLAAYRMLIFHTYPDIQRKERRALPSCIYLMIRALYMPTGDDEEFADHDFSIYIPESENDD